MSIKYVKVKDILTDVLTSDTSEYRIHFTQKMNKASYRDNMRSFVEKDNVWCIQFKRPFADRYIILKGDYRSLKNMKYNSKTNARRNIQRRLVDIDMDMTYFESAAYHTINFVSHNGYESNKQVHNYKTSIDNIRQKLIKQRQTLHNALMSPNVSYRAYPRFKS